jgi:hypothetical protein
MDLYSLVVESFTIHDTRSPREDSVFLNVTSFVDGVWGAEIRCAPMENPGFAGVTPNLAPHKGLVL